MTIGRLTGAYSDFGGERNPDGGFWFVGGLRIANVTTTHYIPSFRVHATLGYSLRSFAIGIDLGGSAAFGGSAAYSAFFGWGSVDAGLAMRFGRVDRTHA